MQQCTYQIRDSFGLHARPAGQLARAAGSFSSTVTLLCGERQCDCKKLMPLMALGVLQGDEITVQAEGADEVECIKAIETFLTETV